VPKRDLFSFVTLCKEDNVKFFKAMNERNLRVNIVQVSHPLLSCLLLSPFLSFSVLFSSASSDFYPQFFSSKAFSSTTPHLRFSQAPATMEPTKLTNVEALTSMTSKDGGFKCISDLIEAPDAIIR
jgi:hypothetical protein